jgi:hypothetical protein
MRRGAGWSRRRVPTSAVSGAPGADLAPFGIGCTVAVLSSRFAPIPPG